MYSFPSRGISSKRRPICRLCEIKFWYDTCYANMTLLLLPLAERRPLKTTLDSIPTRRATGDGPGRAGKTITRWKFPPFRRRRRLFLCVECMRAIFSSVEYGRYIYSYRVSTVTALPATNRGEMLVPFIASILRILPATYWRSRIQICRSFKTWLSLNEYPRVFTLCTDLQPAKVIVPMPEHVPNHGHFYWLGP